MPMGLATIITMLIYVAVPLWPGFLYFTQVLFWIDVVFSLLTCFGVPLYMYFPKFRSPALPPPSHCPLSPVPLPPFFLSSISHSRIMAHDHSIDKLTAVWLLPVVAPIVAGATGGNLCAVIPQDSPALNHTLVVSYILWGIGIPFAMSILVLYIHRLTVYKVLSPSSPSFRFPLHSFGEIPLSILFLH